VVSSKIDRSRRPLFAVVMSGLALRLQGAGFGLAPVVVKYGGSVL